MPNGRKDGGATSRSPTRRGSDWYLHGDGTLDDRVAGHGRAGRPTSAGRSASSGRTGGRRGRSPGHDDSGARRAQLPEHAASPRHAIAGPISATLYVADDRADTELFVSWSTWLPTAASPYLQRGLLRASHRAIDAARERRTPTAASTGRSVRTRIRSSGHPRAGVEYLVEVWPVGHVFRPGTGSGVKIHAPPFVDSYYVYVPRSAPGVNTVLTAPITPSRSCSRSCRSGSPLGPELPAARRRRCAASRARRAPRRRRSRRRPCRRPAAVARGALDDRPVDHRAFDDIADTDCPDDDLDDPFAPTALS